MTDKIKDLLAVLDLPEYDQFEWLEDHHVLEPKDRVYAPDFNGYQLDKKATLADLAFRLRDEACGEIVHWAARLNYEMSLRLVSGKDDADFLCWLVGDAQPIHWIIAALIAKEMAKEKT